VVIDRNREGLFGRLLPDDVFLKEGKDFARLGQIKICNDTLFVGLGKTFFNDLVAEFNTLVTDVDAGARNELSYLLLAFATEGTLKQVSAFADTCHGELLLTPIYETFEPNPNHRRSLSPVDVGRRRAEKLTF
jgi:hypothetical protein